MSSTRIAFLSALCLLGAPVCARAPQLSQRQNPERVEFVRTFRVTMTTTLTVPQRSGMVTGVEVLHALPNAQPWSNTSDPDLGATDVTYDPPLATIGTWDSPGSKQLIWKLTKVRSGESLKFESSFTVRSARRTFDPFDARCAWPALPNPPPVNDQVAKLADDFRTKFTPTVAVLEFCKWISDNLTYDATVDYAPSDVGSTLASRRGHCGHFYFVLQQMCRRVGLPIRAVTGLNLVAPIADVDPMQKIRADWANTHTWAQVLFPGIGWVEIDPSLGDAAFTIPATYIQNNSLIENYTASATVNGHPRPILWRFHQGRFLNDYQLENKIDYKELPDR